MLRETDKSTTPSVFPLKYRKRIALISNQELTIKKLSELKKVCTAHFTFDKAWTKGRALYMGTDESRVVCLKTKTQKFPKAHLVLVENGIAVTISDITKDYHTLDCDAYNQVVEAFMEECLTEEFMKDLTLWVDEDYESLDTVMCETAAEALEIWELSCQIDAGRVVSSDMEKWREAVLAVVDDRSHEMVDGSFIREWLKKTNNWRPESYCEIERFAELWDYSISLLADYRKPFEERYHELTEMYHNCVLDRDVPTLVGTLPKECVTLGDVRNLINASLFVPEKEEDLDRIDDYLLRWIDLAYQEFQIGFASKAIDICLIVLDEIGRRFEEEEYYACYDDLCPIEYTCLNAAFVLTEVMRSTETKQLLKERVLKELKEIAKHNSFADYGYFDMAGFVESKGIYQFPKFWKPSVNAGYSY